MVSVGGFEPPVSCVRGRHFGRAKLHAAETDLVDVMAAQEDLVEIVHTLRQVLCVKG